MAEVVSSIVDSLVEKLASLAVAEIKLVHGVNNDREKLKETLETIQNVLAHADKKQIDDGAVVSWLSSLRNFFYEADDVLDEFEATVLWRQARSVERSTFERKVRFLSSWMTSFIFQFKIAHVMKNLRSKLRDINEKKNQFQLSNNVFDKAIGPRKESDSFIQASDVVGRNEENERLIELLIGSDDKAGQLGVIPIIGMGGAGKTTLAKLVYNDYRVKENFEEKVWLSMPVVFEEKKIIKQIIQFLDHEERIDTPKMPQDRLRSIVKNKKCLFVMDDMWEVKREDWVKLRNLLEGVSKGSKVIVTSRNQSIANIMGAVHTINLADLSSEESLTLFVKCAFDQGEEKNHQDLMEIGKEIVSKCMGNPLAVKTLGSSLYSEKDSPSYWKYVRDNKMWQLKEDDILPSLKISYDLMPLNLKKCFAYCSIFPKSHVFSNLDLIRLWISNGLIIQSSGSTQKLEEIGRQHLKKLWSRSFFDIVHKDYPVSFFRMHDLIHDLAIFVARTESSNMEERVTNISSTTRHILFANPSRVHGLCSCLNKLSGVRSIMFEEGSTGEFFLKTCISRFKSLRMLWLDGSCFDLLPSSIGGLKLLRFLTIRSNRNIKKLPKSVCELLNLQYLGLGGCTELEELPANIKNLINLRVLSITTKQQRFPEGGIGCLTSLQWLFIGECKNLETLFDDIQLLMSLRKLFIWDCPKLAFLPQGIKNLKALEDLGIWRCTRLKLPEGESNKSCSMSTLQSLRFQQLPKIISFPGWLKDSASKLQVLIIEDCPNLVLPEWLQDCRSLKRAKIERCHPSSAIPPRVDTVAQETLLGIAMEPEYP